MLGRAQEHQISYAAGLLDPAFQADRSRSTGQLSPEVEEAIAETIRNLCEFASDHLVACGRSSGLSDPEAGWEKRTWGADYVKSSKAARDYLGVIELLLEDLEGRADSHPDGKLIAHRCLVGLFDVLVATGAPIPSNLGAFISRTMLQPHVVPRRLGKPPLPSNRDQIIHDTIEAVARAFNLRATRGDTAAETVVSACDVVAEAMKSLGMRPDNFETIRKLWYSYRSDIKREGALDAEAVAELEGLSERPDFPEILARFNLSLSAEELDKADQKERGNDDCAQVDKEPEE